MARSWLMTIHHPSVEAPAMGDQIVRRPRTTDAVGRALRGVFTTPPLPSDMARLLNELDRPCG
jgi:hypothetical protein